MKQNMILVDGYANLLDEYVFYFNQHEADVVAGKCSAFDAAYLPVLRKQGVQVINVSIGGEHTAQVMYGATDKYHFWDAHCNLDKFLCEEANGTGSFILCRSAADIDRAIAENKIAVLTTLSGGKPLEGKSNYQTLANLRTLYRSGVRSIQLTGNGRNRLADGCGQHRTKGKLTDFGDSVVREADRLGVLLDTAQLNDSGFFDLIEQTKNPVIDSHTASRELSDHPQCITKERMQAIGQTGGVIGISFRTALVAMAKDSADVDDLLRQIDFAVEHAGIDHVALGPDYCGFKTPKNRELLRGFANLGEVESDYQTPYQSEKYPGYMDCVWYGIRQNDFVEGPTCRERFLEIVPALRNHGYTEEECAKILGENLLRVYRQVLK